MKTKIAWLVVSCLMVVSLLMVSCAPAVEEEEGETVAGKVVEKEAPGEKEEAETEEAEEILPPEVPKYGGMLTRVVSYDNLGFDQAFMACWYQHHDDYVYEEPLIGDWTRGPMGTNETSWFACHAPLQYETGCLAESWEFPDSKTIILHIRKGIHWQDKPPVNGREFVAEDVAFTLNRICESPQSYQTLTYPGWFVSATATDKWTVVIKASEEHALSVAQMWDKMLDTIKIIPPEVVKEYGDLKDWRHAVGTGPFMLVDYVPNSTQYLERNPNYWGNDPLHPENQLPYLDALRVLVMPDSSTRIAALRTAKADFLDLVTWDNRESLLKTNPELKERKLLSPSAPTIYMRLDRPEEPFSDIRVRQALALSIDNQSITEKFYGGPAVTLVYVIPPPMKNIYTPLEELPEGTRQLFEYHPDQARQLLTEAGYPDGFKTEIICLSTDVDMLSVVKEYWADIGVDLDMQVKEYSVWVSLLRTSGHEKMITNVAALGYPYKLLELMPGFYHNLSHIDDPYIKERHAAIWAFENMERPDIRDKAATEAVVHALSQAYAIPLPVPYNYRMWQPWVQNCAGVHCIGYCNRGIWPKYAWIDQQLKKSMGY